MCVIGDRTANDRLRVHIMFKPILFLCLPAPKQRFRVILILRSWWLWFLILEASQNYFFTGLTVMCIRILSVRCLRGHFLAILFGINHTVTTSA